MHRLEVLLARGPARFDRSVWHRASLLCLLLVGSAACAGIPKGRYGVDELELEGVEHVDEYALKACLATHEREDLHIDLSKNPSPTCGEAPFDAEHIRFALWRWPWARWPLYEPSVFERDLARIERWYRARGYYGARVLDVSATPSQALYGHASGDENKVRLTLKISEGDPVIVHEVSVEGADELEPDIGAALLTDVDAIAPGDRFDEATFDDVKSRLLRTLRDAGYADAEVTSHADLDPKANLASLHYAIAPGAVSELGDICIEGYEKLPPKLILQASDLTPGKPYSEQDLEDARTRIYQMRVFSEVEIIAGRIDPKTGASQFERPGTSRDGEWLAFDSEHQAKSAEEEPEAGATQRTCRLSRRETARPRIPIEIRVKPAKLWRFGVGTGIQIGVEDYQRAYTAAQQWDVHVFTYLELRNFFGGLRRFRIEERPKLVFLAPFPRTGDNEGDSGFEVGNNLSALLEWPAFLENRTLLRITSNWDRGPDPFGGGFIRDDIDVGVGPTRDFMQNRLHASVAIHENPYLPHARGQEAIEAERYNLLFLQQVLEWDARDDKVNPTRGTMARLEVHEAIPPSDWGYVRLTPELRRYQPLKYGIVLAYRAGIGMIEIYRSDSKTNELRRLGPRPYRLRGGGPYSVRGVQAGQLGMRSIDLLPSSNGQPRGFPGGTRSWIASVELRIPLGESFGVATFVDAGDVDGGYGTQEGRFRFDHPNTTLGAGLRYKTLVGPIRLDVGWLVPHLSGASKDAEAVPKRDPLFKLNGAVHLTIGEAF